MDINLLRGLVTVFSLAVFIALVVWTYRRSNKDAYSEAAEVPFLEEAGLSHSVGEKQ